VIDVAGLPSDATRLPCGMNAGLPQSVYQVRLLASFNRFHRSIIDESEVFSLRSAYSRSCKRPECLIDRKQSSTEGAVTAIEGSVP